MATKTKGTKGIFGNPSTSLTLFNSEKTFLFKSGTPQKSNLVVDKEMKACEDSVHNTLKDLIEIRESCLETCKAPLGNGLGCQSNQVDGTEKKKSKLTRPSREKKSFSPKGAKNLKYSSLDPSIKPNHPTSSTLPKPTPFPFMDYPNRRPPSFPSSRWAIWHRNKAIAILNEVIAQIRSTSKNTMSWTEEGLCIAWKHMFPITPDSVRIENLVLDHPT